MSLSDQNRALDLRVALLLRLAAKLAFDAGHNRDAVDAFDNAADALAARQEGSAERDGASMRHTLSGGDRNE